MTHSFVGLASRSPPRVRATGWGSRAYRGPVTITTGPRRTAAEAERVRAGAPKGAQWAPLLLRLHGLRREPVSGPGVVVLAGIVAALGVSLDLVLGGRFGVGSQLTFLLASVGATLVVRRRALATAAVLPPLLFVGSATSLAWLSGRATDTRELGLDVGTTLATSAPLLFATTLLALGIVAARLTARLFGR